MRIPGNTLILGRGPIHAGRIHADRLFGLTIGTRYSRDDLVRLWGLKGRQAISRGVVTPAGASEIILFVTQHKTADMTEYYDQLVGEALTWEGDGVEVARLDGSQIR